MTYDTEAPEHCSECGAEVLGVSDDETTYTCGSNWAPFLLNRSDACEAITATEDRIADWHEAREKHYDAILDEGGLTNEEWLRINERRTEHRVSAHQIRTRKHRG